MYYLAIDVGNVLARIDFDDFLNCLSKHLNITRNEAFYFLERTQKSHDLGLSKIKDELIDHFKIKSEVIIDEIMKEWNNALKPCNSALQALSKLVKEHNVNVAIVSNVGEEHTKIIDSMLSSVGLEDKVIKHYSCQVGARKPSKLYYQSLLMQHPEFKGCLYVDDLQDNLDVGKSFGFKTYQLDITKHNYYADSYKILLMQQLGIVGVQSIKVCDIDLFDTSLITNGAYNV